MKITNVIKWVKSLENANLFPNLVKDSHVGMPTSVEENVSLATTDMTLI